MAQKKGNGRPTFRIDFDLLDKIIKPAEIEAMEMDKKIRKQSYSSISIVAGHGRTWLWDVRSNKSKIDIREALKIANHLGCTIQDFGKEDNGLFTPVIFDKVGEVVARKKSLEEKYPEKFAELFAYLEADESNIDDVLLLTSHQTRAYREEKYVGSEWVKMLYISSFARTLSKKVKGREYQNFADAYKKIVDRVENDWDIMRLEKQSEQKFEEWKEEQIKEKMCAYIQKLFKRGIEETLESDELFEAAAEETFDFLYGIFLNSGDPYDRSVERQIQRYKYGELF